MGVDIKSATIKLYDKLPQDKESRSSMYDIRDQIIELNMPFFNYIATHTFLNNSYIEFSDRLQSVVMHFCECWYWYRWEGHYRTDLSFAVFYFPRISEMIKREFNEVKYSTRRTLCMEVGNQVGKHWGKVTLDDVDRADISPQKLESLKAMFGTLNPVNIEDLEYTIPAKADYCVDLEITEYDDIKEMIIQEMIHFERPLRKADIKRMSNMYGVDQDDIVNSYPIALEELYCRLQDIAEIRSVFG